jgi:hypothetical protein
LARWFHSIFAGLQNFNGVCSKEFGCYVCDFCEHTLARQTMSHKNYFAFMSSYTEPAIGYPQYFKLNLVANYRR